MLKSQFFTI